MIEENPLSIIDKPKYKAKEKQILTTQQQEIFIEYMKNINFGDYYIICLLEGLRPGECRALRYNDIDIENLKLTVDESYDANSNDLKTKNESSNRVIPIFNNAIPYLEKYSKTKSNDFIFN